MMAKKYVSATCPKCGRVYLLGKTGVGDGCDRCMGIVRDRRGWAWGPDEMFLEKTTGAIQRKAVFKKRR